MEDEMAIRTVDEIVARAKASKNMFGFDLEVLLSYVPYEQARPWLKPETTAEEWKVSPLTEERLRADMADHMEFAWGKVEDHRGISAGRSVEKIGEWIWLLGDEDAAAKFKAAEYPQYGAPKLLAACESFGLPVPDSEPIRRMCEGDPCEPGCCDGCGR